MIFFISSHTFYFLIFPYRHICAYKHTTMKIKHPRVHTLAHTHIHKNILSVAGRNIVMFELIFRKVGRVRRQITRQTV